MRTKLVHMILWAAFIIWICLIFGLSSQNGGETAKISGGIAQKTAEIIHRAPTEKQVAETHFIIRKLAHAGLFLILGILSFSVITTTFRRKGPNGMRVRIMAPIALTSLCGFFDEWRKQFIDGRHFDPGEAVLNICCGAAGVWIALAVAGLVRKAVDNRKKKRGSGLIPPAAE